MAERESAVEIVVTEVSVVIRRKTLNEWYICMRKSNPDKAKLRVCVILGFSTCLGDGEIGNLCEIGRWSPS